MGGSDTFELGGREWPKVSWWKMRRMRNTYLTLWAALITSATNGYDGSLMNGLESMKTWRQTYHHPNSATLGLLVSIMYIGGILAIPITPIIADRLGRRVGIIIGCSIMLAGVALVSVGVHVALFIVGRLVLGFGLGIAQSCSPLLLSELVHPQHRPQYTTIYNSLWYVGAVIGSVVALGADSIGGDWSWRVPCLLQAIPSACQLIFIWLIPESPRWLISHGKFEKAKQILAQVHADGDMDDELVNVEFHEIQQTISLEKEYEQGTWAELFRGKGNRHRVLILITIGFFSQWSGNGLFSYYLPRVLKLIGITGTIPRLRINMYMQIVNVISAVGICFFVDKIGRRPLFQISTCGMLACYVAMTVALARFAATANQACAPAFLFFLFAFYVFYNLAFSGMLVSYSAEILPYHIRAKGLNLMYFCVDLSLFFNTYANPSALHALQWKYYIVYCVWLVFEIFVVFKFYVETKQTALEEIAKYFDGDKALFGGSAKARELGIENDEPGAVGHGTQHAKAHPNGNDELPHDVAHID